ncbi:MAG: hypothetical protein ACOC0P_07045 [Planctomycetota bacterium]
MADRPTKISLDTGVKNEDTTDRCRADSAWPVYQRLVLERLDEHREALKGLRHEIYETRIEVAQLQIKSSIWGMIGGAIPILIALAFMMLSTGCWTLGGSGRTDDGRHLSSTRSGLSAWLAGGTADASNTGLGNAVGGTSAASVGRSSGGGASGSAASDPFWPIGLIAVLCLIGGVLLLLTRNLVEGAIALGTAIGLMMLRAVLQQAGPLLFIVGLAAGIFFIGQYWGDLKLRRQAKKSIEKIDPEERTQRPELQDLDRIAHPWTRRVVSTSDARTASPEPG